MKYLLSVLIFFLSFNCHSDGYDIGTFTNLCNKTIGDPIGWDPDTWTGPAGGDEIHIGEELVPLEISWSVTKVDGVWRSSAIDAIAESRIRRKDYSFLVNPDVEIGVLAGQCIPVDIAIEVDGVRTGKWNEDKGLYVGWDILAAEYGWGINIWSFLVDEKGRLTDVIKWKERRD